MCKLMNIKAAFLQRKQLEQLVYLNPLKKLMYLQVIFRTFQNVYMVWLMLLDPMKSGAVTSKYGQTIFTYYFGDKLQGIIVAYVDFCFAESEIV